MWVCVYQVLEGGRIRGVSVSISRDEYQCVYISSPGTRLARLPRLARLGTVIPTNPTELYAISTPGCTAKPVPVKPSRYTFSRPVSAGTDSPNANHGRSAKPGNLRQKVSLAVSPWVRPRRKEKRKKLVFILACVFASSNSHSHSLVTPCPLRTTNQEPPPTRQPAPLAPAVLLTFSSSYPLPPIYRLFEGTTAPGTMPWSPFKRFRWAAGCFFPKVFGPGANKSVPGAVGLSSSMAKVKEVG